MMEQEKLMSVIESILFIHGEPMEISDLCKGLNIEKSEVVPAVDKLIQRYYENSSGLNIIWLNSAIQMCTNDKNSAEINSFFKPVQKSVLSQSAIETLSIIAYKQPITKSEIEVIRRVKTDYTIRYLLFRDIIKVIGRKKSVGKPALYATTDEFLKLVGISSIEELPDISKFLDDTSMLDSKDKQLDFLETKEPDMDNTQTEIFEDKQ